MADNRLYIGLMSGTSLDAIDAVILESGEGRHRLRHQLSYPFPPDFRDHLLTLCEGTLSNELEQFGLADRTMGKLLAEATTALLNASGVEANQIHAIGSHGQTVRHRPPNTGRSREQAFTIQLGDPNTIAEITGITTVADFRRRDIAAGGQGAPLVPAFHAAAFALHGRDRVIANIGGMSNISVLTASGHIGGFDTGPGNVLMDSWIKQQQNKAYDKGGNWAQSGKVNTALLEYFLRDPYYQIDGPKSTGREQFGINTIESALDKLPPISPEDVQATLLELTATTLCRAIQHQKLNNPEVFLCGGGASNFALRSRISQLLPHSHVDTTDSLGISADWVEAAAFAWLAKATLSGQHGNVPAVTGASGCRILGAIYPA